MEIFNKYMKNGNFKIDLTNNELVINTINIFQIFIINKLFIILKNLL